MKCRMGLVLRRGTRRGSSGPVWMCWFEMTMRCMCEDDRLRNAEEGLVGGRKQSGCSVQRWCGHRRDHSGDCRERLGLILGLDKLRSGPVKDTESHGKTRRGCCLKGKGTELQGGRVKLQRRRTEKGPVASATWRPLVDIADVFQEVRLTVEADWRGLRREGKEDIEMMST